MKYKIISVILFTGVFFTFSTNSCKQSRDEDLYSLYQQQLSEFREEFSVADLPEVRFFLFGMGNRTKLLYKNGQLMNALTGEVLYEWKVRNDMIIPNEYRVDILTGSLKKVSVYENESGVYIKEDRKLISVDGTDSFIQLPDFQDHKYSEILKVLHQEILINIVDSRPVPNFFVYQTPWRRDAAMMAMCLNKTGNIDLIRDWVLNLDDPYDHNNKSDGIPENETDNLGQTLFLLSFFTNRNHHLVKQILNELPSVEMNNEYGIYISGRSDFANVPVYQTKWLKFGLHSMNMEDPYNIPFIEDNYSSLFWMDYRDHYVKVNDEWRDDNYPYIGWARDHFYGTKLSPVSDEDYPLTWETLASQANYEGMRMVDSIYTNQKTSVPHTWHAAEVFLYLLDQ